MKKYYAYLSPKGINMDNPVQAQRCSGKVMPLCSMNSVGVQCDSGLFDHIAALCNRTVAGLLNSYGVRRIAYCSAPSYAVLTRGYPNQPPTEAFPCLNY